MNHQPSEPHPASSVLSRSQPSAEPIAASIAAETPPARGLQLYADAEFLPTPRPLIIAGGWAALMTFGGAIAASGFIPYNVRIPAPTVVRPQNELLQNELLQNKLTQNKLNSNLNPEQTPLQPTSALALKAWVPNANINQVAVGQPVQVRLASCPYPDFGVLPGEIVAVSPDVVRGAATAGNETSTGNSRLPLTGRYEVHISPQVLSLDSPSGKLCHLRAGMQGRADILVGRETILRFLLRKARLVSGL